MVHFKALHDPGKLRRVNRINISSAAFKIRKFLNQLNKLLVELGKTRVPWEP